LKISKKYVTLIKNKKIEVGGTMKTFLKGLWGFVEIIIIIYVICMTAFLLCKNKYGFTEIGNMSFFTINENLAEYLPETKDNDLLLVKSSEEDIKVGDKIYYYARNNSIEYTDQHRICPHGRFRNQPSRNAAAIQEGRL
jgi:intein/homing endonuclease